MCGMHYVADCVHNPSSPISKIRTYSLLCLISTYCKHQLLWLEANGMFPGTFAPESKSSRGSRELSFLGAKVPNGNWELSLRGVKSPWTLRYHVNSTCCSTTRRWPKTICWMSLPNRIRQQYAILITVCHTHTHNIIAVTKNCDKQSKNLLVPYWQNYTVLNTKVNSVLASP